ncbi:uncharacterized protein L3040_005695 [Drepanopeziza brunnea f. sp. 'multigermtubi']|uniref:uncharacterized protein n=1 Tax=Drepanopeziza brunnea f. sp. 'multigermtubi' TaxID=698441 RepID=UPI00239BC57A|nr:hypothetical protein L3040_005695 [Drepanopeziza brunnea f. sp. 'multigermtubi']
MAFSISSSYAKLQAITDLTPSSNNVLSSSAALERAEKSLPSSLPACCGRGEAATQNPISSRTDPPHSASGRKTSAHYYGFVTGGVFPHRESRRRQHRDGL